MISTASTLLDLRELAVEMRERRLQRWATAFVGAFHLVKDAPPRQLQTFAFLAALSWASGRRLPRAARSSSASCRFDSTALLSNPLAIGKIGVHVARLRGFDCK
jgi:uncharacterized membrane protein YjjB (DUF3815 family)